MKFVHVFAFVFLGVWLLLTGFFGLADVAVTHAFAVILNVLAFLAGILFLISVGKGCCHGDSCCNGKHKES
jgi:hypothetical protein